MSDGSSSKPISEGAMTALAVLHRAAADAQKIAIQTNTGIVIQCNDKIVEMSYVDLVDKKNLLPLN